MNEDNQIITLQNAETFRSMIQHQETRIDERIKGMLTLQGFLFAAIGFSWGKVEGLSIVLSIVGLISSLALSIEAWHGKKAIINLLTTWDESTKEYNGPPLIGLHPSQEIKIFSFNSLTLLDFSLGIVWGCLLGLAIKAA